MYAAFVRTAFQAQFAYRAQVWAGFFGAIVVVYAKVAIWTSVYQGTTGSVAGITLADMITYALIGRSLQDTWAYHDLLNTVERSIRSGDVAVQLLKPMHYPFYLFANEAGVLLFRLLTITVPTVAIVAAFTGMLPPASLFHGIMFVVFWALAFLLLFLMAAACGLLAFWLMTAFSLDWLLGGILLILSGGFIPLWFFPESIAGVVATLPFAFVGYYPAAVYLGKLGVTETWTTLGLGLGWAFLLMLAVAALWSRAERRIVVQGG